MNNTLANDAIVTCLSDFDKISGIIEKDPISPIVKYLTNYCIITSCGSLEFSFKTIIADYYENISPKFHNYLDNKLRGSSCNPTYQNILSTLKDFDPERQERYKNLLKARSDYERIHKSLDSLNNNRNSIAHGINISTSFNDVHTFFKDSIIFIETLDIIMI